MFVSFNTATWQYWTKTRGSKCWCVVRKVAWQSCRQDLLIVGKGAVAATACGSVPSPHRPCRRLQCQWQVAARWGGAAHCATPPSSATLIRYVCPLLQQCMSSRYVSPPPSSVSPIITTLMCVTCMDAIVPLQYVSVGPCLVCVSAGSYVCQLKH